MFEKASSFVFTATSKYNLQRPALGSLICLKVKTYLKERYSVESGAWIPKKFNDGVLTIEASSASAHSDLYLKSSQLIVEFEALNLPAKVVEIKVTKSVN